MSSTSKAILIVAASVTATLVVVGLGLSIRAAVLDNQRVAVSLEDRMIESAKSSVRSRLKDPASAQFSQLRIVGSGPDARVCGFVNAKNSFGGYSGDERFVSFLGTVAVIGENERPSNAFWSRKEHPCDVL